MYFYIVIEKKFLDISIVKQLDKVKYWNKIKSI